MYAICSRPVGLLDDVAIEINPSFIILRSDFSIKCFNINSLKYYVIKMLSCILREYHIIVNLLNVNLRKRKLHHY